MSRAIDSILQADGTRVLAVDDACPDRTGAFVSKTYNHERRVEVITSKTNLGLGETRNIGIDQSSTEYIAFLDADDFWTQSALVGQACEAIDKSKSDVGFMPVVIEIENGKKPSVYPDYELIAPLAGNSLDIGSAPRLSVIQPCWSMIYRRQFLIDNQIRFHRRKFEDHDFGLEVVLTARSLLVLAASPTVHYDKTRLGTLSSSKPTGADHQIFLAHVARVIELLNSHPDIPEQSRTERASNYTYRLVYNLLELEHPTDGMIHESLALIHALHSGPGLSDLADASAYQSGVTKQLLNRHPFLAQALDRTLTNPSRFIHFIRLLRFARKQNLGKAKALSKLGLRVISMPWK